MSNQLTQPLDLNNIRTVNEHLAVDISSRALIYSADYEKDLTEVKNVIDKAEFLLSQDIDTNDDDQIDQVRSDISSLIKRTKVVSDTRIKLKSFMADTTTDILSIFDHHANSLGYNKLPEIEAKMRTLRDTQLANRKEKRWEELKGTFDATIMLYPNIIQLTPRLADFNDFKIRHQKLVTGDKKKNIGDKQRAEVSNYLNTVSELLNLWEANTFHLTTIYHNQLLEVIQSNPARDYFYEKQTELLAAQQRDEETRLKQEQFRKQQEEQAAMKALQAQQMAQNDIYGYNTVPNAANMQQSASNTGQPISMYELQSQQQTMSPLLQQDLKPQKSIGEMSRSWLGQYITTQPQYHDVGTNATTQVALIHDIMHQLDSTTSPFSLWLKDVEKIYFKYDIVKNVIQQVINI